MATLAVALLLYLESFINHDKDLDVFIGASRLVFDGQNCYEVWLRSGTSGLKYFYSPLFAVLLFPIKDLSQVTGNVIWLLLNLLVIVRIFKLLPYYLQIKTWPQNKRQLFYLFVVLLCGRFVYDCFSLGQMTFILLWGSLESLRLIKEDKKMTGGALLALIINIKLLPIALLTYLIYKRELLAGLYTLLFFVLYLFLPAPFIGFQFNSQLLGHWYGSITATNAGSILDDYGRQSLSAFVPALLMDTPIQFNFKRNFINLPTPQVELVLNGLRLLLLLALAYLFGKPFQKINSKKKLFYNFALLCLITPLFFPHQGKYSFVYLLPAQAYCVFVLMQIHAFRTKIRFRQGYQVAMGFLAFSFILLTLSTDGLIGRRLSNLCEYLQLITLGSLLLLITMVVVRQKGEKW